MLLEMEIFIFYWGVVFKHVFRHSKFLGFLRLFKGLRCKSYFKIVCYSETLNNEYIERIHEMLYSSLSDNGMLQIFSFLIK